MKSRGNYSKELKQVKPERKVVRGSFRLVPLKRCIEFSKEYNSEVDYIRVYLSLLRHLQKISGGVSK